MMSDYEKGDDFIFNFGQQVWGSVELEDMTHIDDSKNKLIFSIDKTLYSIEIPPHTYKTSYQLHSSTLVDILNDVKGNSPVQFRLGGFYKNKRYNVIVIEHEDKSQPHVIEDVTGSSGPYIFGDIQLDLPPRN